MMRLLLNIMFSLPLLLSAGTIAVKTKAPQNRNAVFQYRVPKGYDKNRREMYRVLVIFGGRNTGSKVEEFLWGGLALVWRSGVTYVNEPYVTGGNPVLAGDDVLFNDMLGSTLAINGNPVEMTSFGETDGNNAFFTGKPMIDELGYAFLFRAYDPAQGKWTTSDPLGYPDGWNNLAYCNNGVTVNIDWLGAEVRLRQRSLFYSNNLFNHTWLDLVPDVPGDFSNNAQLNPSTDPNRNRGTVSGMPDGAGGSSGSGGTGSSMGDHLISAPNADIAYSNNDGKNFIIISAPSGMTDSEFINAILAAQNKYDNSNPLPYAGLPAGGTYSSNSFIAGILNSLGLNGSQLVQSLPGTQPGAGNPVPIKRFE